MIYDGDTTGVLKIIDANAYPGNWAMSTERDLFITSKRGIWNIGKFRFVGVPL